MIRSIAMFSLALLPCVAAAQNYRPWRYYRALQFDTTASGAAVSGDVAGFPVPVALTAADFDFTQAKDNGSDVRFSETHSSAPLAHSVEHWDRAAKSALLWVKVPVVKGNSKRQSILMHWGNLNAAAAAPPTPVFDAREGFVGVWHLDEEGSTAPDGYKDATASAAHGTGVNLAAGSRVDGRLGKGVQLDHAQNQWIKVDSEKRKLFDVTNKLTFSIWARARSYSNKGNETTRALPGYETMFAKGDNSWRMQKFGTRSWHKPPAELVEMCVERLNPKADLCVVGKTDMATGKWFHFTVVHDHPTAKLYTNGALDHQEKFDSEWTSGDHPVGIGNQSQFPDRGRSWDGVLDEARFLKVVKYEHCIKLYYESQREGQKFLTLSAAKSR
jgi:hypothetical protein